MIGNATATLADINSDIEAGMICFMVELFVIAVFLGILILRR